MSKPSCSPLRLFTIPRWKTEEIEHSFPDKENEFSNIDPIPLKESIDSEDLLKQKQVNYSQTENLEPSNTSYMGSKESTCDSVLNSSVVRDAFTGIPISSNFEIQKEKIPLSELETSNDVKSNLFLYPPSTDEVNDDEKQDDKLSNFSSVSFSSDSTSSTQAAGYDIPRNPFPPAVDSTKVREGSVESADEEQAQNKISLLQPPNQVVKFLRSEFANEVNSHKDLKLSRALHSELDAAANANASINPPSARKPPNLRYGGRNVVNPSSNGKVWGRFMINSSSSNNSSNNISINNTVSQNMPSKLLPRNDFTTPIPSIPEASSIQQFELDNRVDIEDENVQVIIRIRPLSIKERAQSGDLICVQQNSARSLTLYNQPEQHAYTFDHVAGEHVSQESLFIACGSPMVENCMAGYNSTMFAYGQTGSGKTYTMLGDIEDLETKKNPNRGIIPRIFESLFARIKDEIIERKDEKIIIKITCSFVQIYNEQICDLLDTSKTNLQLREGREGVYIEDVTEIQVDNLNDIVNLLLEGAANRKIASTEMNDESSRSHSVFTCKMETKWVTDNVTNLRYGRLNLVDLAGSERQKSSHAIGDRLKEASSINKSLSHLGHVIMILVEIAKDKKERHVPYRDSKLTFLLQDSLGGNSKTTLIANITPSLNSLSETWSTLKFAQRAKMMINKAVINEDSRGDTEALRSQIRKLKEEINKFKSRRMTLSPFNSNPSNSHSIPLPLLHTPDPSSFRHSGRMSLEGRLPSSPLALSKKVKTLEAILNGSLRREQSANKRVDMLNGELEQLNKLLSLREVDIQNSRMILKFREDKISRMEKVSKGELSAADHSNSEINELKKEIIQLKQKVDRNPTVTQFAIENIRLTDKIKSLQQFFELGEKEKLENDMSLLRDQFLELSEFKSNHERLEKNANDETRMSELEITRLEADTYQKELADARINLQRALESNSKLATEAQELEEEIKRLRSERSMLECELLTAKSGDVNQSIEVSELLDNIQKRQVQYDEEKEKSDYLLSKLNQMEIENKQLNKDVEDYIVRISELEDIIKENEESINLSQQAARAAEASMEKMREELEQYQMECKEMKDKFSENEELLKEKEKLWLNKEIELKKENQDAYSLIEEFKLRENYIEGEGNEDEKDYYDDDGKVNDSCHGDAKVNDSQNEIISRNLFMDNENDDNLITSTHAIHSTPVNKSKIWNNEIVLRQRAEERSKKRKEEIDSAIKAALREKELRIDMEEVNKRLENELSEALLKLNQMEEMRNAQVEEIEKSLKDKEEMEKQLQQLDERDESMAEEIEHLRDELSREREFSSEANKETEKEWKKCQQMEREKAKLERELEMIKSAMDDVKNHYMLQLSIEKTKMTRQILSPVSNPKNSIDFDGKVQLMEALEREENVLTQVSRLTSQLKKSTEELQKLRGSSDQLTSSETVKLSLNAETDDSKSEFYQKKEMEWEKEMNEMKEEIEKKEKKISQINQLLQEKEREIDEQKKFIQEIEKGKEEMAMDLEKKVIDFAQLSSLMKEKEEKIYEKEIKIKEAEAKVIELNEKIIKVNIVCENLRKNFESKEEEIGYIKSQYDQKNDNEKEEIKKIENKLIELKSQIEVLKKDNDEKSHQIMKMAREIVDLKKMNESNEELLKEKDANLKKMKRQTKFEVIAEPSQNEDEDANILNTVISYLSSMDNISSNQNQSENFIKLQQRNKELEKEVLDMRLFVCKYESLTIDEISKVINNTLQMPTRASNSMNSTVENSAIASKENEINELKKRMSSLKKEKEMCMKDVTSKDADLISARLCSEEMIQRVNELSMQNSELQKSVHFLQKHKSELESEVQKFVGQNNPNQRIHQFEKNKKEKHQLEELNSSLQSQLKQVSVRYERVVQELATYRQAEGKNPILNLDGEEKLRLKLQQIEEARRAIAKILRNICIAIINTAGMDVGEKDVDPAIAVEALNRIKSKLNFFEKQVIALKQHLQKAENKQGVSHGPKLSSPHMSVSSLASTSNSQLESEPQASSGGLT